MAMLPNGRYLTQQPGRKFGPGAGLEVYGRNVGDRMNQGDGVFAATTSAPDGYGIRAMVPARVPGGMSTALTGSGQAGGPAILALLALATLSGSGGVTGLGGLIVNLAATIAGSGGISSAAAQAFLNLIATISGGGGVTGAATGRGALAATVSGTGGAVGSTATGIGNIGATLRGYGDLTPEGLRDAVWGAILESGYSAEELLRILTAVAAGKTDINTSGPNPVVTFRGLGDTTDRVTATMTGSERTTVVIDPT